MANKKNTLSKPSRKSQKLSYKVRFNFQGSKDGKNGFFVVTNSKRKIMGAKQFNNHDSALEYALELNSNK